MNVKSDGPMSGWRRAPAYSLRAWVVAAVLALGSAPAGAVEHYRHFVDGNTRSKTPGPVSGGLLLMGGGDGNYPALRWFVAKAGHGHVVVLRASETTDVADDFFWGAGNVASVETFVFDARSESDEPRMLDSLARADGIFIAGGDQARYVRFWKGTPVARALDAHVQAGKPLGGTSAGLAMLGQYLYGAMDNGSVSAAEALADPLGPAVTIETDFLHLALLKGVITDTHVEVRHRLGRLFAFLVKAETLGGPQAPVRGLGVDEAAAVAVESDGTARVFATNRSAVASLVQGGIEDVQVAGRPLTVRRIHVTGIGVESRLDLIHNTVERPAFERDYTIEAGHLRLLEP